MVFVQARMNSSRLPGKALLPISGFPMVVLAALRAGNQGAEVVVVTSEESSDDELVRVLDLYGVCYFRGELNNVLSRYVNAGRRYRLSGKDIIVRLTADNLIPDGFLIDELVNAFIFASGQVGYIGADYPADGLPYGVNAEVFYFSDLEDALRGAESGYDLEHVTPWIKRNRQVRGLSSLRSAGHEYNMAELRLTVDVLSDYERMVEVFESVFDKIDASWKDVCCLAKEVVGRE